MITNAQILKQDFLAEMYQDPYFPDPLVDKGKAILLDLCVEIEQQKPLNLDALYKLTHAATERFNALQDEFEEAESEIETAGRDAIGTDFAFIAQAYGFNADTEELIAPRDW